MNGIKFWCYNAGHVLGAAMFMLEIAGVKILYTGTQSSYSCSCQRLQELKSYIQVYNPRIHVMSEIEGVKILYTSIQYSYSSSC